MPDANEIKQIVKEKYGNIVKQSQNSSCCDSKKIIDYEVFTESYQNLSGHFDQADLGLGCGLPTEFAKIKPGDTVLDLGSGAGNDVFVARALVGEKGKVIGVDMTNEMIEKANDNKAKLGYTNIEFRLGEIEDLPIENDSIDVIVSNCVLNLVPDKKIAFSEMYRVLKTGGHFSISDIVLKGELPQNLKKSAEMYAGCVAGASQQDNYLEQLTQTGFQDVEVQKTKTINLPEKILSKYLTSSELKSYKESNIGIFSITVFGRK